MSAALFPYGTQDAQNAEQESTNHHSVAPATLAHNGRAPIYNLNIDILWRIFSINADIYWSEKCHRNQASPLLILRRSSHVCHEWRSIILSSTVLWGMVIELGNSHWEEESLRRAGGSPLFITGVIGDIEPEDRPFFRNLVNNHWTRIRILDIEIESHEDQDPELWKAFQRPAPNLEIFKLHFYGELGWEFPEQDSPLFADNAPVLRELQYPNESPRHSPFRHPG